MSKSMVTLRAAFMEEPIMIKDSDIFHHYDTNKLPISSDLKAEIAAWDEEYQMTFNSSYPPDSAFKSPEIEKAHVKKGDELARRLQIELGDRYIVEYKP